MTILPFLRAALTRYLHWLDSVAEWLDRGCDLGPDEDHTAYLDELTAHVDQLHADVTALTPVDRDMPLNLHEQAVWAECQAELEAHIRRSQ